MKQVTIVVPKGNPHLSSIAGTFEILTRANAVLAKDGKQTHDGNPYSRFCDRTEIGCRFLFGLSCRYSGNKKNRPADYTFCFSRL